MALFWSIIVELDTEIHELPAYPLVGLVMLVSGLEELHIAVGDI